MSYARRGANIYAFNYQAWRVIQYRISERVRAQVNQISCVAINYSAHIVRVRSIKSERARVLSAATPTVIDKFSPRKQETHVELWSFARFRPPAIVAAARNVIVCYCSEMVI